MICWGKLNSTQHDCSEQRIKGCHELFHDTRITEVSVRDGLATYLIVPDRRVTAVTSNNRKRSRSLYKRITLDLETERVAIFSCGQEHVVLVSEAGALWEWTRSAQSNSPMKFSGLTNKHIAQVACGNYHSVVLTRDGQVFTWGQNSSGQLGLGKDQPGSQSPQHLKSLCGIPLAQISAGGDHGFALSLSGAVFGWGRNNAGQLGLGVTDDRQVPVCVKSLNLKKTVFISCGEAHTAVLTKVGLILTFGSGHCGQLGHNSFRDELHPRVVAEFWGSKVSQIACGRHHTLALVEPSNTVYSFGCGEQGQLGNGQRINQCVPHPVQLPPEYRSDQMVKKMTAGGNLSVLFISKTDKVHASSNQSSCKGTDVLNDDVIDRWISHCNSKVWKRNKREIKKMFSSASCINGSFCEQSNDKHYKTSTENSGLDLSLARLAFEKMAKKEKVLLEVAKVVEKELLPSLCSTAAGVEALRVYLILPELLRVLNKQRATQLTIALASAMLNLGSESMDVLRNLWTKLPWYYYRTLVKTFHSACAHFISLMMTAICDHWTEVLPLLKVLKKLYTINSQRATQLPEGYFIIKQLIDFFNFVNQHSVRQLVVMMRINQESGMHSPFSADDQLNISSHFLENADLLMDYPFILDMQSKCTLFRFLQLEFGQYFLYFDPNTLCVNRETVLADTLVYLKTNRHDFSLPLQVKFSLEAGIDYGGLCAEYFTLLGQEIARDSSVISASEDSGLFWFSADDSVSSQEELYYIGVICGLALYNNQILNIGFPLALFKKLLNLSPTLSDLEELSPVEARSLKNILLEDEDVVEVLDLDFMVNGKELIPNGADIPVTKGNRQKYVDLYVDFILNKSVERQFRKFEEGFCCGIPYNFWTMFKPEELSDLLYGSTNYKWEELQQGVTYEQCGPSDELIQNFWSVFFELNEEQRKKFLTFVYGTDRLPVGGLSKLRLKVVRHNYADSDDRFPSAQTCFGMLHLPRYSNIHILRDKLIHAISYCDVFGQK